MHIQYTILYTIYTVYIYAIYMCVYIYIYMSASGKFFQFLKSWKMLYLIFLEGTERIFMIVLLRYNSHKIYLFKVYSSLVFRILNCESIIANFGEFSLL